MPMPVAESLIFTLGPTLVKAIVKVWLKDKEIALASADGAIDYLKTVCSDALALRKGAIQLDKVATELSQSLLSLANSEYATLPDNERTAAVNYVNNTILTADLSPAALAKLNYDPIKLFHLLKRADRRPYLELSADATYFYDRLLSECSQLVLDIASAMPRFSLATAHEMLTREADLMDVATRILAEFLQVRDAAVQADDEHSARFESDYRNAVARNLDMLELYGVEVSHSSKRHQLSVAYISLAAETSDESLESDAADVSGATSKEDSLRIESHLSLHQKILIKAQAGGGKTTLLQWLAVRSALASFEEPLTEWNQCLPFFIRLREFAGRKLPPPEEFPQLVAPAISGGMPDGWAHKQLREGRSLLLIDGVDEVPRAQREEVRKWIMDLDATFSPRIVVSSRPTAIDEDWLLGAGFKELELLPMSAFDIDQFIIQWHEAVKAQSVVTDLEDFRVLARDLIELMSNIPSLRLLATSPLLCAMICALNRDRKSQLPTDRIELYEACCYLLLERRDRERKVDLSDYPELTYRQKTFLLQQLAYWLLRNTGMMMVKNEVTDYLTRKAATLENVKGPLQGASILRFFLERTGMLREPSAGLIDFTHRTFQDYLAASACLAEGDFGLLVANATEDQWREMVVIAAGLADPRQREAIFTGILDVSDQRLPQSTSYGLLAMSCLETTVELNRDTRRRLERKLRDLVPPRNLTEAKSLASARDLATRVLTYRQSYTAPTNVACVRSLALIGTPAALAKLEAYAADNRVSVQNELMRSASYFEPEAFAEKVLRKMLRDRTDIHLQGNRELRWLPFLDAVKSLIVEGASDLGPLTRMMSRGFQKVAFVRCGDGVGSLQVPETVKSLFSDRLHEIDTLEPVGRFVGLEYLELVSGSFRNSYPARRFPLNPWQPDSNKPEFADWRFRWSAFTNEFNHRVRSLGGLENLVNLRDLAILGFGGLEDIRAIGSMGLLESLDIEEAKIDDWSPLLSTSIKTLVVSGWPAGLADLLSALSLSQIAVRCRDASRVLSDVGASNRIASVSISSVTAIDLAVANPESISRLCINAPEILNVGVLASWSNLEELVLRGVKSEVILPRRKHERPVTVIRRGAGAPIRVPEEGYRYIELRR